VLNSTSVEFVDREEELKHIGAIIQTWSSRRVVGILGEGGLGKTRILNEIRTRYTDMKPNFSTTAHEKLITVAVVQEFTDTEWSEEFMTGAKEMARELGVTVQFYDAKHQIDTMITCFNQAIENRPDIIILRLGTDPRLKEPLDRALDAGIKIIGLDNYLSEDRITTRIIQDYIDRDTELVRHLASEINFQGSVLTIFNNQEILQSKRRNILQEVLAQYPDINVQDVRVGDPAQIYAETLEVLKKHPDIHAVWTGWDSYTPEILRAIKDAQRTDIYLYSYGLNPSMANEMLHSNSPWHATIDTNPTQVGRFTINISVLAAIGEGLNRSYSFPTRLVDRDQIKGLINENGILDPEWLIIEPIYTPALRERRSAFAVERRLFPPLSIIDFDDLENYAPENIIREIAEEIGESVFADYLNLIAEHDIANDETRSSLLTLANENFIEAFNRLTYNQRVLIFFDTIDDQNRRKITESVLTLLARANNLLCFIAGRDVKPLLDELKQFEEWKNRVEEIQLQPFENKFSLQYLRQKQARLSFSINENLEAKLLLFAQGRPILLDLAADWLSHNVPLDWLDELSLEELRLELEGPRKKQKIREFEYNLIRHIGKAQRDIDWLILIMARIYPMNPDLIAYMLKTDLARAQVLYNEAQTYTFVKILPDGQIKLHDVMQGMVNTYLWEEIDPREERRKRDSERVLKYYQQQIQEISDELRDSELDLTHPVSNDKRKRALAILRGKYIYHLFYIDFTRATQEFVQIFETETIQVQRASREILLEAAKEFIPNLPFRFKHRVFMRQARHQIDQEKYEEARQILEDLLAEPEINREDQVTTYSTLANYYIQTGKLEEAIRTLKKAIDLCQGNEPIKGKGKIYNTFGLVYRMMGKYKEALEYYQEALEQPAEEKKDIAATLNNVGYIHSLNGQYEIALRYCQRALEMRHKEEDILGIGACYSTIGEIYRNWGRYDEAMRYYYDALAIFEPNHVTLWLAKIYSYQGAVYRLMGKLPEAEAALKRSIHLNIKNEQPWAYHVLGCVLWNSEKREEALKEFDKSYKMSVQIHDVRTQINNLVGAAEIYHELWGLGGNDDHSLTDQIRQKAEELERLLNEGYDFSHHHGRMLRVVGDMYFDQNNYDQARETYAQAYSLLGKRLGGYGRRTFEDELRSLETRIRKLAQNPDTKDIALEWCGYFKWCWSDAQIMQTSALVGMCNLLETEIKFGLDH